MFSKTYCASITGIDAVVVQVEADISNGLPGFEMVGFLASQVKEARERVRVAIKNSKFQLPPRRITINLSPADIRKEGTAFDLPVAVAILAASGIIPEENIKNTMFIGEVSLDGKINPVNGVLPMVFAASRNGFSRCFVPMDNQAEGGTVGGMEVIGVNTLLQTADILTGKEKAVVHKRDISTLFQREAEGECSADFSDVLGQCMAKRAAEVAVAGRHNMLLVGSPGSGKTMLAKRIPGIMPFLSLEESFELSRIYSVAGKLPAGASLMVRRPFREVHHSITRTALIGGGKVAKPGELSLATHGVLFLDEFSEFQRASIEALRQPLEERKINIARVSDTYTYPADVMLIAAMNPCLCGFYPDRNRCRCSEEQVRKYMGKISGPILDRIDICIETLPVELKDLQEKQSRESEESSDVIRKRVLAAWEIQKKRYRGKNIFFNSQLNTAEVSSYCKLGEKEKAVLKAVFEKYPISVRGYYRILKLARTIADLEGAEHINVKHLSEAVHYRNLDKQYSLYK